jgi:starch-binding outer membrane protein, SusD/RagB family
MKKLKYIFISIVFLAGCNDLLDTNPSDFYTADTFWETSGHALEALTGCYQVLVSTDYYGSGSPAHRWEVLTPNAFNYNNELATRDFSMGAASATTLGINNNIWVGSYRGIGRCNNVLENIQGIDMDADLKERIIGEAKFLRAFYYFHLNEVFGGVPLIVDAPNADEHSNLPRNSYEEVLSQILQDLDDAADVLPVSYSSSDGGRATKGAALAMKARTLLQNHRYNDVVNTIDELFNLNQYSLFPDYNGLFRKANEGNSEIVFDVRFNAPEVTNNYDIFMAQYSTQAPLKDLIDSYQMIDGSSIEESELYDPENPYVNRDPRFAQSIVYLGAPWRNRVATDVDLHQTGYTFRKFTEYNETTVGTIPQSDVNYVVIRYADVLLMYAEALNELNGPVQEVYDAINDIRTRPTVEMPEIPANLDQEEMREVIRLERRIELAGEQSYFFDIRRWGIAEDVMNAPIRNHAGNVIENRSFNPNRDYIWPIPFTQIDLNPALEQNPGY